MALKYIVTCIKNSVNPLARCMTFDANPATAIEIECQKGVSVGDIVDVSDGKITGTGVSKKIDDIELKAEALAESAMNLHPYKCGIGSIDKTVSDMWPKMLGAAKLLLVKLILGAPIIMRFHNDADGASGAYALYKSIDYIISEGRIPGGYAAAWVMNRSITYSISDAEQDGATTGRFSSVSKPLLFIMDFGTSQGSNAGIKLIRQRFDIIWIDHHPIEEGFIGAELPFYINPWQHNGNSELTSGFLVSEFSKTFSQFDTKEIENASFIGDHSPYADKTVPGQDMSDVLDMITSDVKIATGQSSRSISPKEIDSIINDKDRYAELVSFARMKMSDAIVDAMQKLKKYTAGNCTIYVSGFEDIRSEDTKYPLPGRFSSKLLEKLLESKKHAILLLHFGNYISIRVDPSIAEKANILGVISELKEKYAEEIESGGGHITAANIKIASGYPKEDMLRELISMLKEKLK